MQIPDVPPQLLAALVEAAAGQRLALVGGVVRDLLLHRHHQDPWRGLPDLDLVVEGRAADLVERLPQALEHEFGKPIPFLQQPHGRYGTVELELLLPSAFGGRWLVDLASARREVYSKPAHNPDVIPGTLEQDLARRDFTVNAMALVLNPGEATEAQLLDPFDGHVDLTSRQLRFLHAESTTDDPTRLLRAARYSARLGFDLADQARRQVAMVLGLWPWPWKPGDRPGDAPAGLATRLRMELDVLLECEPWRKALLVLQQWGGLSLFDIQLQQDALWPKRLNWAKRFQVPLLPAMVANADDPMALALRLQIPHRQLTWLRQMCDLQDQLLSMDWPTHAHGWCEWFEAPGCSPQAVALAIIAGAQPRQKLLHWFFRWRHVHAPVSGADLLRAGWPPGPGIGIELKRLRRVILEASC